MAANPIINIVSLAVLLILDIIVNSFDIAGVLPVWGNG
jgi:hypothetical protein